MKTHHVFAGYQLSLGITTGRPESGLPPHHRRCYQCHETKPRTEFGPSRANKSGLTSWCRACLARYNRERRVALKRGAWDRGERLRQVSLTTPMPSSVPSPVDLGWAAGFLEGEGCFIRTHHSPRVKAVQVNLEPLLKLQRIFGGNIYRQKAYRETHSPSFLWAVNGKMALAVIGQIYEMLSAKRQMQADAIMHRER